MSAGAPGLPRWRGDHRGRGFSGDIAGVVIHHPWREGIHSDALRAELGSPGAGEGFEGTLRCSVDSTCGDSEASDPGAEVDDDASASFDHCGDHGGGEKERRLDVDREDPVESVLMGCEGAVGWVDTCVVDEDGDGSEGCSRIGGELRRPRGGPVEVGSHEGGMPPAASMRFTT